MSHTISLLWLTARHEARRVLRQKAFRLFIAAMVVLPVIFILIFRDEPDLVKEALIDGAVLQIIVTMLYLAAWSAALVPREAETGQLALLRLAPVPLRAWLSGKALVGVGVVVLATVLATTVLGIGWLAHEITPWQLSLAAMMFLASGLLALAVGLVCTLRQRTTSLAVMTALAGLAAWCTMGTWVLVEVTRAFWDEPYYRGSEDWALSLNPVGAFCISVDTYSVMSAEAWPALAIAALFLILALWAWMSSRHGWSGVAALQDPPPRRRRQRARQPGSAGWQVVARREQIARPLLFWFGGALLVMGLLTVPRSLTTFDYELFAMGALFALCSLAALFAAGSVARERARRTWDDLLSSRFTGLEVFGGKLIGVLWSLRWLWLATAAVHLLAATKDVIDFREALTLIGLNLFYPAFLAVLALFFALPVRTEGAAALVGGAVALGPTFLAVALTIGAETHGEEFIAILSPYEAPYALVSQYAVSGTELWPLGFALYAVAGLFTLAFAAWRWRELLARFGTE
jgi:hypothetical protein